MTRLLALVATLALFIASVTLAEAQVVNPTISTVAVTSDPGTDDTYALGDNVDVELTFSEAIAVTGAPYLVIDVGGTNRRADYHGTSSDNLTVTFRYTVLAGDDDDDGIAVVANSLVLNDGTIRNSADTADATLDHAALTTTDHKVDIVVTLLSNFGQTASSSNETISATQYAVFEFTVGENSGGYQLDSVVVDVKSPSDTLVVEARIHTGTSELYSNPDASEPKATLRGSVTSAGRQTFTMDPGPSGNLVPTGPEFKGKYYLVIVGSGSGTVQLGRVAGDGEDSGNSAGWVIEGAPDFIEGVDNPLDYNYLKVDVRGHPGAIPYLRAASVRSTPLNGHTYHAGEHIEIIVQTSVPVTPSNVPGRLPLWLGIGEEFYRGARPVAAYFRHDYSWSVLAVYEVREGDTDTDGVVLDDQLVWDNNSPIWTNALDTTVPISHSLEFATIDTGPEHPVDGSQKWGCEQLLCASAQFFQEYADHFGVFSNEGSISNRYFRYLDEDYVFITMIHGPSTRRDYFVTFLHLSPALTGSEQVVAQGAIVFSGTVLPLRDSYRELRGANSFGWPYQDTFIRWERAVVSWTEGEAPLIKLVENVDVSFATDIYTVDEDGTIEVEITLSLGLGRDVTVPITVMNQNGASDEDYDAPEELTIEAGLTSKKFVITPVDDELDDDGESLLLEFGDLPENLSPGTTTEAVVTIIDNDDPEVEVSFEQATHTVAESDDTSTTEVAENQVVVKVILSADPERTVVIPLAETLQGGATSGDYSGVPANVVFNSGDTEKTFTFTATDDTVDDDDESVRLGFGTLPDRVSEGATAEAVVNITDDDAPESVAVSFGDTSYTVTEGSGVQVTVLLDDDPEQTIRVPIFSVGVGATGVDYDVPVVVEFNAGETSATITLQAIDDEIDDDDESVRLGFGPALPEGVTQRTPATTEVFIIDNDLAGDSLLSLVVAPKDVDGFDPEVTDYMVGLASTITRATITATPAQQDATVAIDGTQVTSGSAHAVDLSAGLNTFEVVVTSADNEQTTYTVHIGRGTTAHGGWKAGDDLDTLRSAGNTSPAGAWSNGTTIWISDVSNAKLYAYSQADGVRVPGKDIALSGATMRPHWNLVRRDRHVGHRPGRGDRLCLHAEQRRPGFEQRYQPRQRAHAARGYVVRWRHHVGPRLARRQAVRLPPFR